MSEGADAIAVPEHVFVVVPAYNEGPVIRDVVAQLCASFPNVVVVNDGSADDTPLLLRDLPARIINHPVNLGQGAALQTGISYALMRGAEYIVTFDSDGQHRIEDAIAVLNEVRTGSCDVACGSRFLGVVSTNIPLTRKVVLRAAVWFTNLTTGTRRTDAHNGLRALSRKAAQVLDITQDGMAHASEITSQLAHHGMIVHEVPVQINYTDYSLAKGQSSLNAINIVFDLIVGRFLK